MNKITKTITGIILVVLIIGLPMNAAPMNAAVGINESITKMKAKQINYAKSISWNDTVFVEQYDVIYFVTVHGNPTYTFNQREFVNVNLQLDNMNSFNNTIEQGIKKRAKDLWNYTYHTMRIRKEINF